MADKITEQLYIADIEATDEEGAKYFRDSMGVDWMINLSGRFTGEADVYYPLKDGAMEDQQRFDGAVENVVRELEEGKVVCVNCAAGVSRSVSVAAAALADYEDSNWVAAFQKIKENRPAANPHPAMRSHARKYLGEIME